MIIDELDTWYCPNCKYKQDFVGSSCPNDGTTLVTAVSPHIMNQGTREAGDVLPSEPPVTEDEVIRKAVLLDEEGLVPIQHLGTGEPAPNKVLAGNRQFVPLPIPEPCDWGEIANKPSEFPSSAHTHTELPTTGQKNALAGTNGTPGTANKYVTETDSRLSDSRTPTAHTHTKSQVTDFAHSHPISEVTNLQSSLDAKAATSHNHDSAYSAINHNHDSSYATTGHTHANDHARQHSITSASDHTFPGGTTDFLRADGIFATPSGGSSNPVYTVLANGATAMAFAANDTVKVTPTANATYTTTVPPAGKIKQLIVLTSGTTSRTITFGTGFKPVTTLATGTVSARVFVLNWISDGTNLYEVSRTAAIVA